MIYHSRTQSTVLLLIFIIAAHLTRKHLMIRRMDPATGCLLPQFITLRLLLASAAVTTVASAS